VTRLPQLGRENYYITITNASRDRDIVVTHVWFDTPVQTQVFDQALPIRLRHGAPWETVVPVDDVAAAKDEALWLARCQLSPDDKVVKSKPRLNVPPFGTVPRG
jgi:hypothetical protein